jgi:hypothetical protein
MSHDDMAMRVSMFAALLHDMLGLRGVPRNTAKPGYFANYGLAGTHDAALTSWMKERHQPRRPVAASISFSRPTPGDQSFTPPKGNVAMGK